jgi:hypothetical protein
MILGAHSIIYSKSPVADRAFRATCSASPTWTPARDG